MVWEHLRPGQAERCIWRAFPLEDPAHAITAGIIAHGGLESRKHSDGCDRGRDTAEDEVSAQGERKAVADVHDVASARVAVAPILIADRDFIGIESSGG